MNSSYIVKMLAEISTIMNENKDRLIELDSVVGDGDLGLTMTKGFAAASEFAAGSDETDAARCFTALEKQCQVRRHLLWVR